MPDPEEICGLHYVIEGTLYCEVEGEPPLEVKAGELLLLPRNDRSCPFECAWTVDTLFRVAI